jgi:opacity protein-like surface antigen
MKKIILTAAAVLAFGLTNAQDMKFGAKAGLNVASISGLDNSKSLFGANLGVFAEFKISDKFAVQPEILFSMQGAKGSISETETSGSGAFSITSTFNAENKAALNYINIPIMAKFFVTEQLSLQAGPQIGFLMSLETTSETSGSTTTTFGGNTTTTVATPTSSSSSDKSNSNSVDFGLNFGAGYDITENIFVEARYNLGLNNINKNTITGQSDIKNRVISVNLGYKF